MSLDFITADPSTQPFMQGVDFQNQQRDVAQKRNVDTAIRTGVSNMLSGQGSDGSGGAGASNGPGSLNDINAIAPSQGSSQPSISSSGSLTTPASDPTASRAAMDPASVPTVMPAAPPGMPPFTPTPPVTPTAPAPSTGKAAFLATWAPQAQRIAPSLGVDPNVILAHWGQETGWGAALHDNNVGNITAGAGWQGPSTVRGDTTATGTPYRTAFRGYQTPEAAADDYARLLQNRYPGALNTGANAAQFGTALHAGGYMANPNAGPDIANAAATLIGGAPTQAAAQQAGGAAKMDPSAANAAASSILAGLGGGQAAGGGMGGMGGSTWNARYNPILEQLAQTPGGGATAIQLMSQQNQFNNQQFSRQTQLQRLAMQAASRGDATTARYYAGMGGLNLPDNLFQDEAQLRRLGTGGLIAERMYATDPAGAQRFLQSYMQNPDLNQAAAAGGTPTPRSNNQLVWQPDPNNPGREIGVQVDRLNPGGQAQAVTGPDGQPLSRVAGSGSARVMDRDRRLAMLRAGGMSDQEANLEAGGGTVSPNTVANVYQRTQSALQRSAH